jgi:ribonuclease HII
MQQYYDKNNLEVGVDEVARGCLAGRVYAAAVIWPKEFEDIDDHLVLKDSKKLSKEKRLFYKDYIEENAIDFSIGYEDEKQIDKINIRNATFKAMHKAINGLNVEPESIIVDGNSFPDYSDDNGEIIPHKCVVSGDAKYAPIACASILAKVYHDEYIEELCESEPNLKKYGWLTNMCYGTEEHLEAIKNYGISKYHRKTFGVCKNYSKNNVC